MLTFYGDFACPYCYVESELLSRLGVSDRVRFRPVSLLPDAPVPWDPDDPFIGKIFADGWDSFLEKNPDVHVVRPPALPNTQIASQAVAEALDCAPDEARALGAALFRALWRDARDIGHLEVVLDVWRSVGLPERSSFSRDSRVTARLWRTEWRDGPFSERVPVIASEEGQRLLGLPTAEQLLVFFEDRGAGGHTPEVCKA